MTCRLCGSDVPLIKAHIIPKPFFLKYGTDGGVPRFLSNTPGVYPKRVPVGLYDRAILCRVCDARIGDWDHYGIDLFLRHLDSFEPVKRDAETIAFSQSTFDYKLLRLFLLSVLWRAHLSTHPAFQRVRLGPYADILKRLIELADPGDPSEFDIVLSVFTIDGKIPETGVAIMDPFREHWEGVSAYRLSLGLITAYIKVDQAQFHDAFLKSAVRPGRPLVLLKRDYRTSSERRIAQTIARDPQNRRAFRNK
jgi:hypothetical protein